MMNFEDKWYKAVAEKSSILCVGIDPAEHGQRPSRALPAGADKLAWCVDLVEQTAPYAAAIKPNRSYIEDFSRTQTRQLVQHTKSFGLVTILDRKAADIGSTLDSAIYHAAQEGFDAMTFVQFAGNWGSASKSALSHGVDLFSMILMSNPEYASIKGMPGGSGLPFYLHAARQTRLLGFAGGVIGAPSDSNHLTEDEITWAKAHLGGDASKKLILMPGIGAQGGEAEYMVKMFGDRLIVNVGRAVMYAGPDFNNSPAKAAEHYNSMLNDLRKSA